MHGCIQVSTYTLMQHNHIAPAITQSIKVVSPLLNLIKALCQVLGAVVAPPVRILDGMRQIGLNRQWIKVQLINQHGSGAGTKTMPALLIAKPEAI